MQELLLTIQMFILGLFGFTVELPPVAEVSREEGIATASMTNDQIVHTPPELIYKNETYEIIFPDGRSAGEKDMAVPYIVESDNEFKIFPEQSGLRVDYDLLSPSGRYIYFSKGIGKDAGVIPYVFDIRTKTLHKVCLVESCNDPYAGFAAQYYIDISWLGNDALRIEYTNPGLAPGASESGPAIGLQIYESVSVDSPWETRQIN